MAAATGLRERPDRRALSVPRFIDQCGVCRVVAPVDFFGGLFLPWTYAYLFRLGFSSAERGVDRGRWLVNGPSGKQRGQNATEDILDSDQYGRHSRGMQRRYRGECLFLSSFSVLSRSSRHRFLRSFFSSISSGMPSYARVPIRRILETLDHYWSFPMRPNVSVRFRSLLRTNETLTYLCPSSRLPRSHRCELNV